MSGGQETCSHRSTSIPFQQMKTFRACLPGRPGLERVGGSRCEQGSYLHVSQHLKMTAWTW
jgi:hypothetical protein